MTRLVVVDRAKVEPYAVGASEVGAVLGCDPYTTPLALYRRKRGLDAPQADNLPMRIGRELEGPVVRLAREAIPLPVRRNRRTFAHPGHPLFATPDAFVGRDRVLEAKVVGYYRRSAWGDTDESTVPCHVGMQVQAQLMVTGRDAGYVAALIGTELRLTLVERDVIVQASIADAVTRFVVDHLEPGVPPDPLTFDERWAWLLAALDDAPARVDVLAGATLQAAGDRLLEVRQEQKELEDEERALRAELLEAMGQAGTSRLTGNGWTASASTRPGTPSWQGVARTLAQELEVDPDWLAVVVEKHRGEPVSTFTVREHRSRND